MRLGSCRKAYRKDTHRAVSPEETLSLVENVMPAAGITRVADITHLDRIGIPVFTSIRPMAAQGAISVYNGKGATAIEARVSAIMEGIERYSSEAQDRELVTGCYSRMTGEALDPRQLVLPSSADPDAEIPWVRGTDIMNQEEILVPANAVFHPLPPSYRPLFRTNTTGLASGNRLEEAIFHGLAEVIERDAWSIMEFTRKAAPVVVGVEDGLPRDLVDRFIRAEVDVHLRDLTSDIRVPTVAAISDDIKLKDPALLTTGMGTHTDAGVALLRALTEVAQSRLTQIHGAREDAISADFRRRAGYERIKRLNKHWFEHQGQQALSQMDSFESDDFLDDISFMLNRLEEAGVERTIVVDLSREELGVPVVRVIVPGLEIAAVDSERVGKRCRDARDRDLRRSKPRR